MSEIVASAGAAESLAAPAGGDEILRFGVFEVDLRAGELRRGGVLVHLSHQPFRLLALLASRAGRIVGREEIRERLWGPEVHVEFDQGINTLVREVRRALHDDASSPRFVATVPRRGYRFVAPVERVAPADGGFAPPGASGPSAGRGGSAAGAGRGDARGPFPNGAGARPPRPALVGLLVVLMAATGYVVRPGAREAPGPPPEPAPVALAVLPFESLAAEGGGDPLGAGLGEELIAGLGRRFRGRLRVIAPIGPRAAGGGAADPRAAARELGAQYLLIGTIRRNGRELRVSARLMHTADAAVRWAATYQRDATSGLEVQKRLATSITEALAVQILPPRAWSAHGAASDEAFAAYLRGQNLLQRARKLGRGGERALPAFERALELDSGFARAWVGLARATLWTRRTARLSRARRYLSRGLALDDELAEGHLLRGELALFDERDFDQALRSYQRALEIDPHSQPARRALACWYLARERRDGGPSSGEATERARSALRDIDGTESHGVPSMGSRPFSGIVQTSVRPPGVTCPPAWAAARRW